MCMATWHVSVDSTIITSTLHRLALKSVRRKFESLGFTVNSMPELSVAALSVSHASASAITLYLLKHSSEHIVITRVC